MRRKDQPDALELLGQSDIWIDGQGVRHFVRKMELRHIRNTRAWIMRNGTLLADQAYREMISGFHPTGEEASSAFDTVLERLLAAHEDPVPWLEESELIQAFDERLGPDRKDELGTREITVTLKLTVPNHREGDEVRHSLERVLTGLKWQSRIEDFTEGR